MINSEALETVALIYVKNSKTLERISVAQFLTNEKKRSLLNSQYSITWKCIQSKSSNLPIVLKVIVNETKLNNNSS